MLLAWLGRILRATTMTLENLLAAHKRAVAYKHHKPSMERTHHSAVLAQVLHRHTVELGRPDATRPSSVSEFKRAELPIVAQRNPLDAPGLARCDAKEWPDLRCVWSRLHVWIAKSGGAAFVSKAERVANISELWAVWRTMSKEERGAAVDGLPSSSSSAVIDDDAAEPEVLDVSDSGHLLLLARSYYTPATG